MTHDPGSQSLEPLPPPAARRQPLWTYFLTPVAVVIAGAIIATAIFITDDDSPSTASPPDTTSDAVSSVDGGSASPASLLAAFNTYAEQVGLDTATFEQCLGNVENANLINEHLQVGSELGINGTPTFYINNKKIVGSQPTAVFVEVIERELEGSPTSVDVYSDAIQQLAASTPPRFEIVDALPSTEGATFEGNPEARVVIAEFSDFQCPFCARWTQQSMGAVRDMLGDDVALAFMHYPLTQIHPNAGNASLAAICAGQQDKFWEMHDLLFARQDEWKDLPPR